MSFLETVWSIGIRQYLDREIPDQGDLNAILSILNSFFPRLSRSHSTLKLDHPTSAPVHFDGMVIGLYKGIGPR
ncbi:hypothetical protein BKA56DRAFT_606815 [Ilyonectria sp. MPI-CAGE-AT-0026]|nr:hypothetical protein BKA56DRAFT_606815 [Ilyonectria sp. MPI-CAGE-AT-0026]